jgi:Domain of unknown function (DUF6968)
MNNPIAEAHWIARNPAHKDREVILRIWAPTQDQLGDFSVMVEINGFDKVRNIHGIDGIQALSLALQFAKMRLGTFMGEGWKFYFIGDDKESEPVEILSSYFGNHIGQPWYDSTSEKEL